MARAKKRRNVLHSSASADWGTPRVAVDLARAVLGTITVDPFSSAKWNAVIGAERFLDGSPGRDGFVDPWLLPTDRSPTALVNVPSDPSGRNVKRAWARLLEHRADLSGGALWVCFQLGQLQQLQTMEDRTPCKWPPTHPMFLRAIPSRRFAYLSTQADGTIAEGAQPPHASALVLLPAWDERTADEQRAIFRLLAGRLGAVL